MADLTALALNAADQLPVAELHGAVCALVACAPAAEAADAGDSVLQDLVLLLGADALSDEAAVGRFVEATRVQLEAEDLSFAPLLPADEEALEQRLDALGGWCSSFLAGLAAGLARRGLPSLDACPEEVREIIGDFAAIAQIDPQAGRDGDAEEAEADFAELQEFVKVGALLITSTFDHEADEADDSAQ